MEEYHQTQQAMLSQNETSENENSKMVNELHSNAIPAGGNPNHPHESYHPANPNEERQPHNLEIQEKIIPDGGQQVVDLNSGVKEPHLHSNNEFTNGENSMDVENSLPRNGQNFSNDITNEENNES